MTFHVTFTNTAEHTDRYYADEDVYEFLESGVLAIHRADPVFMDEYFAPHTWEHVDASRDHKPGRTGGPPPDVLDTIR
jgi:hypothetical protein